MKKAVPERKKKEHAPDCTCSLCGLKYHTFSFKSGYICESCLDYIRDKRASNLPPEDHRKK